MREMLFKGQRLADGMWVEGDLSHHKFLSSDKVVYFITSQYDFSKGIIVNPDTICQFTGLYDSTKWESLSKSEQQEWLKYHTATEWKGKRVFESDIVQTKYGRLCEVVWHKKLPCFDLIPIYSSENLKLNPPDEYDIWSGENLKIVGNVYDKVN